jgi:hypothetical protein
MLPSIEAADYVRSSLLVASIQDDFIHFLAKNNTLKAPLKLATAFEATNLMHEGEKGLLYGLGLGLLAGLCALMIPLWITTSPAWYTNSPWYLVLLTTSILGAVTTSFGAACLGGSMFNTDLSRYKTRIANGEILMIVAVPLGQASKIRQIVRLSLKQLNEEKIMASI